MAHKDKTTAQIPNLLIPVADTFAPNMRPSSRLAMACVIAGTVLGHIGSKAEKRRGRSGWTINQVSKSSKQHNRELVL